MSRQYSGSWGRLDQLGRHFSLVKLLRVGQYGSRLGREQIETAYALKQIIDAGVRIFFYQEDRERTLESPMDKAMLSLATFAAEMERDKARLRTHDAMIRKARARHVTGGKVYGYDNLEILSPVPTADGRGKRLYVVRRINPAQAAVIQRIFELYASGLGLTRIAKALNADHVPPPRNDGRGWAPTAIREMLYRPLYRGELVWNRSQRISRGGTKKQRRRPEAEWVRLEAPELRIVPGDLWQAVYERLQRNQSAYPRRGDGGLLGRVPHADPAAQYLLSGVGRCVLCGGTLMAMTRPHGKRREHFYGCAYHHKRGATICPNNLVIRQDLLDHAVLRAIHEVLDERIVEAAVDKALTRLRAGQERQLDRRTGLERELSLIEAQERRLADAIKRGGEALDPLVNALKVEAARKKVLIRELESMSSAERATSMDARRLKKNLSARLMDMKAVLARHMPEARQLLRKLLVEQMEFTPVEVNGRKGYRFVGAGSYGGLLDGEAFSPTVVAPTGFEPVFQP